jgi:putative PIN family toxin of toxin-antitoxin system
MRVVLDCNVLISAARTDGVCRTVIVEAVRHHEVVLSIPILKEYRAVAIRSKHAPAHQTALAVIAELESIALLVEPAELPQSLTDPDDAIYLGTALAGKADALITGNVRDFPEKACGSVRIMTPRAFLDRKK